jgi:hypothetical protein
MSYPRTTTRSSIRRTETASAVFLSDPNGAPLLGDGVSKCSVVGSATDCNVVDWVVLRRAFPVPGIGPGIDPVCQAAN